MPSVIDGYSTDTNVQLVIDDVRALRKEMQRFPDNAVPAHLVQLTAGYLVVNRPVLDLAFKAWRQTPEQTLKQMFAQAQALDENATAHGFESVGRHAIEKATKIMGAAPAGLFRLNEDDLNMLLRVLDYAKYLADCSAEAVRWHPVPLAEVDDRVERLRESLTAA